MTLKALRQRPHKTGNGVVKPEAPGDGHQASGEGWGGPTKGAGQPPGNRLAGRRPEGAERQARLADKQAAADRMLVILNEIAEDAEEPTMARIAAANGVIDRIEGKAIQRIAATPNAETVQELRHIDPEELTIEQRDALRQVIAIERSKSN